MTEAEHIAHLVERYCAAHSDMRHPTPEFRHPAAYALLPDVNAWLCNVYGGPLECWTALLEAGKEWFPDPMATPIGKYFCYRFEAEGNVWWGGREEFRPLTLGYLAWRGLKPPVEFEGSVEPFRGNGGHDGNVRT
ncbi:MAG: hypothetical protein AB7Q97_18605 [Gammaproteobacteria bacterium]